LAGEGEASKDGAARYEALGQSESLEVPTPELDGIPVFFPPRDSTPVFTVQRGSQRLKLGVEICADHEFGSLAAWLRTHGEGAELDVHVIVSDEVYPMREHSAAKHMLHAGRVLAGLYETSRLPSLSVDDLDEAEAQINDAGIGGTSVVETVFGSVHTGSLPT